MRKPNLTIYATCTRFSYDNMLARLTINESKMANMIHKGDVTFSLQRFIAELKNTVVQSARENGTLSFALENLIPPESNEYIEFKMFVNKEDLLIYGKIINPITKKCMNPITVKYSWHEDTKYISDFLDKTFNQK